MALIRCNFFSEALGLNTSITVILPQETKRQIGMKVRTSRKKHPVLFLLHGLSDDSTIWLRRTSIERYVAPLGLAVVMPEAGRSFYTDMIHGLRYWTYISEELPGIARSFFPLSDRREDNFAAGLSMGGYGAFKLALSQPERFAAAASLSGALDMAESARHAAGDPKQAEWDRELRNIFGGPSKLKGGDNDLFHLAARLKRSGKPRPFLYQVCGTEDFLYEDNIRFRNFAQKLKLNLKYDEEPGEHEWGFWDKHIRNVLNWLPIRAC
jgi:S-formylglutathione hydrolase FrmB